jgi:hypothetical protein
VVDQIDAGLGGGAGRGRAARVDRDLDVVPVGFIDDCGDLVLGDRLNIAPGGIGNLDQVDPALASERMSAIMSLHNGSKSTG